MRLRDFLVIACLWIPFLTLLVIPATCQTVSPKQILPATAARVTRPDLPYKIQSDPSNGGKFWYVVDTPSVSTGGGPVTIPNWQQVTDVGDVTNHFVTASGLTLTQLTTGGALDSILVVQNGKLKRIARQIVPAPLTLSPPVPVEDPFNPLPPSFIWNYLPIPPQYQTTNLRYVLFRNGIEQIYGVDYTIANNQFIFSLKFSPLAIPIFRIYAYGFN